MKKSQLIGLSTMAVTLGVVGLTSFASAATSTSGTSLVDKIATKFGLNKTDVQAVFDEEKTERQAERKAEVSERLQDLVDDGKITAEQKTKIEAKQEELQTAREAERTALEAWANDNGVDVRYVMQAKGMNGGNRLDDLVEDGKITAEQKTKIEAKQEELETKREEQRDALETWADENNIDAKYLMGGTGGPGGRGHGGPGGL